VAGSAVGLLRPSGGPEPTWAYSLWGRHAGTPSRPCIGCNKQPAGALVLAKPQRKRKQPQSRKSGLVCSNGIPIPRNEKRHKHQKPPTYPGLSFFL
jgi:hypothetical protein